MPYDENAPLSATNYPMGARRWKREHWGKLVGIPECWFFIVFVDDDGWCEWHYSGAAEGGHDWLRRVVEHSEPALPPSEIRQQFEESCQSAAKRLKLARYRSPQPLGHPGRCMDARPFDASTVFGIASTNIVPPRPHDELLDDLDRGISALRAACDGAHSPYRTVVDSEEYDELRRCHDTAVRAQEEAVEAHAAAREYTERVRASMLREIKRYIAERDEMEDKEYGKSVDLHFYRKASADYLASEREAREQIVDLQERNSKLEKAVKFWRRACMSNFAELMTVAAIVLGALGMIVAGIVLGVTYGGSA